MRLEIGAVLLALLVLCGPVLAMPVMVRDAWFRALPAPLPAAGYFTASNNGRSDIALTGAQSSACKSLVLHHSLDKGGMAGMEMTEKVTIPAGGSIVFAPGGYHLMCDGTKLKQGGKVPVALHFSDGTAVIVSFAVRNAAGK